MLTTYKILVLCTSVLIFSSSWSQEYKRMMNDKNYTVDDIIKEADTHFSDTKNVSDLKQFERWKYLNSRLKNEKGYLQSDDYYSNELKRYNQKNNQQKSTEINDYWEELGPKTRDLSTEGGSPGVGRLTSMAVDNYNPNHIIVGSDVGGVWKTTNEGNTWVSLTDNHITLNVYALAMDPKVSSTYFWGSSNGKIYKSINSGSTWELLATVGEKSINKILIHPTNSNILFASAANDGIYKSIDAGNTWNRVIRDRYAQDVEFNTYDPNIVYASGHHFYRSTDLGENFTTITGFDFGAKKIGVSKADPYRVYVLEEEWSKFNNGFYVSTDEGKSFTRKYHPNKNYFATYDGGKGGQAPRAMDITVSPNNAYEVHIAGIITWRSLDGGDTFSQTSGYVISNKLGYCHPDVEELQYIGNTLYTCTDGGIFLARNSANYIDTNYYQDITTGLGIRAFYKIGISQTSPVIITGGSQDNGTSVYKPSQKWNYWLSGDGMETFIDKNDPNIFYGTTQYGKLYKSIDNGNVPTEITPFGLNGNWVTPFEQDPIIQNTVYAGYKAVYKSKDGGDNWEKISQYFEKNLDHIKIAPSDSNVIYTAYEDRLFKNNSTTNWDELTGFSGSINSIAIHPNDPNKIAIATTANERVYVSINGGYTWESYKKNLPNFSALALVWQDNEVDGLYLGMNYGVYYVSHVFLGDYAKEKKRVT